MNSASRDRALERRLERGQRQRPSSGGGAYYNKYIHTCELCGRTIGHMWITIIFRKAYNRGYTFKMPILLFLLDTSASMNQRTYLGTTYLDVAKGAVEVFMKVKE